MSSITDNDKFVLNAIFNPNYPLDFEQESSGQPQDEHNESKRPSLLRFARLFRFALLAELSLEIKQLETEGKLHMVRRTLTLIVFQE